MAGQPSWQRKFRRAESHFERLADLVQGFLSAEPYAAIEDVRQHQDGGLVHDWWGVIREQPPADWSPIVGDCLNNLRSSLDHLAWGLAGGQGRHTAFPIFQDESEYKRVTPGRHLKYVRKDAHAVIEALQPYRHLLGPNAHLLFLLDRLTNDDKHRELIGTKVGAAHIYVDAPIGDKRDGDRLTFEFEPRDHWYTNGATLTRYYTSNPGVRVPLVFTFDVAFDPDGPATGQPLLTILGTLMMATWMVLLTFEERFFADSIASPIPVPLEGQAEYIGTDSFAERAGWRQVSELTS